MTSIILSGGNQSDRQDYIIKNYSPKNFQISHIVNEKSKISIKQIHDLLTSLSTIPQKKRLAWIEEANLLSLPAQNALLKSLEEPPTKTTFILSLNNPTQLLETIQSRCTIKVINPEPEILNEENLKIIKKALTSSDAQRLNLINDLPKNREEISSWLTSSMLALSSKISSSKSSQLSVLQKILEELDHAKNQIDANCNIRLTLSNLFLNLPQAR